MSSHRQPRLDEVVPRPRQPPPGARLAWVLTDLDGTVRSERDAHARFYAASTMKVAVLIEVFRQVDRGAITLRRLVPVATTYPSGVGGSPFELEPDDVDQELADLAGGPLPVSDLVERMITISSNEATNLLLALVGLDAVAATLANLGARDSRVQRLLGDRGAREAGMTNEVSAGDLGRLMTSIGSGRATSAAGCQVMTEILCRQRYRDEIPAGVPARVRVASKNGWVDGVLHDAALVWPEDAAPFCLVVCTDGYATHDAARAAIREVAGWA